MSYFTFEIPSIRFRMHNRLANGLKFVFAFRKSKSGQADWIHINLGSPASGKSTFGLEMCAYSAYVASQSKDLDIEFTVDNIAFFPEDIPSVARDAPQYGAIMIDEGVFGIGSGSATTRQGKALKELLSIIRENRNLLWVINITDYKLAGKLIRGTRMRSMAKLSIPTALLTLALAIAREQHITTTDALVKIVDKGLGYREYSMYSRKGALTVREDPLTGTIEFQRAPVYYGRFYKPEGILYDQYKKVKADFMEDAYGYIEEKMLGGSPKREPKTRKVGLEYIPLAEFSRMVRVSPRKLHKMIRTGELDAKVVGDDYLIHVSNLDKFLGDPDNE